MASQPGKWEMRSWVQSPVPPPWVQTLAFPAHETGDEELRKCKYLDKKKKKNTHTNLVELIVTSRLIL